MNGKQALALLLAVSSVTAAASRLAEGSASAPAPEPSDLPTAEARVEGGENAWIDKGAVAQAYADGGAVAEEASPASPAVSDEASFVARDAAAQYEAVAGQWTLAELASMDAPPVTGDAEADDALEKQWRALREALENAPPGADAESVLSAAAPDGATTEAAAPEPSAPDADARRPALTGDAKTDSLIEAEWNAAHPAEEIPEEPQAAIDPADAPEAAVVAGPDDGGARPERTLTKQEERDAQKRERIAQSAVETAETLAKIEFAEVEGRAREDNLTVRAMRESVDGLEGMDYEKSEEDLLKVLNGLAAQQELLSFSANEPLAQSFAVSSLQSQYDSLYKTFEQLRDGTTRRNSQDAIEQMRNAMNQVVMGAETLYIAIVAMDGQHTSLSRQLESLNRTVAEMELRYSLGQISALTLNQSKAGRTALLSGMETLEMNIRTYKMQLENMLGASLTGEIELGELPTVTEAQIAALDAERDFAAARDKSYELYAAARTLQDAKDAFLSSAEQYHYNENNASYKMAEHTWTAAQDTYNVTVRGYELKFRTLYEQVRDYYQVWNASKDALEAQKQQCQASELKYKQGNISQNALLSAKDSLSEKEEAVRTAANNLFSSYNNYCWAAQSGILS